MHDLIVREQVLGELLLVEDLAIGDLAHEQLDDNQELLSMDAETNSSDLGSLTQAMDERSLRRRVLKLNSLDTALVVEVARVLIV